MDLGSVFLVLCYSSFSGAADSHTLTPLEFVRMLRLCVLCVNRLGGRWWGDVGEIARGIVGPISSALMSHDDGDRVGRGWDKFLLFLKRVASCPPFHRLCGSTKEELLQAAFYAFGGSNNGTTRYVPLSQVAALGAIAQTQVGGLMPCSGAFDTNAELQFALEEEAERRAEDLLDSDSDRAMFNLEHFMAVYRCIDIVWCIAAVGRLQYPVHG